MVNASLRSHIIRHDQSGFSRPKYKGKWGEVNDIHNTVNKIITKFNHPNHTGGEDNHNKQYSQRSK